MNDNNLNIEFAHYNGSNVTVRIRAHFLDIKPNIAVKCEIWDEGANQLVYSFIEQTGSERSMMLTRTCALAGNDNSVGRHLSVKAGFLWLDDTGGFLFSGIEQQLPNPDDVTVPCTVSITKPRAKNEKETQLYYYRGGGDYSYPNNRPIDGKFKVLLPFEGTVKLDSDEWEIIEVADGRVPEFHAPVLQLLLRAGGGVDYKRDIIPQFVIHNGKSIAWSLNDDWDNYFDCKRIVSNTVLDLYCKFYLRLQNTIEPDLYRYEAIIVSTTPIEVVESATFMVIEPIRLLYGCMAEDTGILMADGGEKPISHIGVGDLVFTTGGVSFITDVIVGSESVLVHIEAKNKRVIRVSNGHPIQTKRGFVRADRLNAADVLVLHGGVESSILALYLEEYCGKVYNLLTANPNSALAGNGFIVGDSIMQNTLEEGSDKPAIYSEDVYASRKEFAKLTNVLETVSIASVEDVIMEISQCKCENYDTFRILNVPFGGLQKIIAMLSRP